MKRAQGVLLCSKKLSDEGYPLLSPSSAACYLFMFLGLHFNIRKMRGLGKNSQNDQAFPHNSSTNISKAHQNKFWLGNPGKNHWIIFPGQVGIERQVYGYWGLDLARNGNTEQSSTRIEEGPNFKEQEQVPTGSSIAHQPVLGHRSGEDGEG